MLYLHALERIDGGIPVTNIADRDMKGVAQSLLLIDPFIEIAARSATSDHLVALFVQALTYRGPKPAHTAGDVG